MRLQTRSFAFACPLQMPLKAFGRCRRESFVAPHSIIELTRIGNALCCFFSENEKPHSSNAAYFHKRNFCIFPRTQASQHKSLDGCEPRSLSGNRGAPVPRSEEHTSELQSHSFI